MTSAGPAHISVLGIAMEYLELRMRKSHFVNRLKIRCAIFATLFAVAGTAFSAPVIVDWAAIGGGNGFERSAISFAPIHVDSFTAFQSEGTFRNLVNTQGSSWFKAIINIEINGVWTPFAENDLVRGTFGSEKSLDDFVFFDIDFSTGPVSGIFIATTGFGQSEFLGMNTGGSGSGTRFIFDVLTVPEPGTLALLGLGLAGIGFGRRRAT